MTRRGRRSRQPKRTSARAIVTAASKGKKLSNPATPPQFTAAPWYPLTIAVEISTKSRDVNCFVVNDFLTAFKKQTGFVIPTLCVRFQEIHAWAWNSQLLEVAVDETPDGTGCASYSDSCTALVGFESKIRNPGISYRWPLSTRQQVKTAAEGSVTVFRYAASANATIIVHLHVLWSFGQVSLLTHQMESSVFSVLRPHNIQSRVNSEGTPLPSDIEDVSGAMSDLSL